MPPTVIAVVAATLLQVTAPLKKSDLIQLLSTSLASEEIADLVQRRCVSFTPSARDKADLRALGADDLLLRRLVVAVVTLGKRAGPAYVVAAVDGMERQASLVALPGPPANLVLRCGTAKVTDRLALGIGTDHEVMVHVEDAAGNQVPFSDLQVTVTDPRTVRVAAATDAVTLRGLRAGRTSVVVRAAGLRRTFATAVGPGDAIVGCRRGVPGG